MDVSEAQEPHSGSSKWLNLLIFFSWSSKNLKQHFQVGADGFRCLLLECAMSSFRAWGCRSGAGRVLHSFCTFQVLSKLLVCLAAAASCAAQIPWWWFQDQAVLISFTGDLGCVMPHRSDCITAACLAPVAHDKVDMGGPSSALNSSSLLNLRAGNGCFSGVSPLPPCWAFLCQMEKVPHVS